MAMTYRPLARGSGQQRGRAQHAERQPKGTTFRQEQTRFTGIIMSTFDLSSHGITVDDVRRNLPPAELYGEAIREDPNCAIADLGALIAYSGAKTGRSPKDKRVVKNAASEKDVWWGPVNVPIDDATFQINLERAKDYLNTKTKLYCTDAFAGWDPKARVKVRVICSRPYHALFMHTMLIRPTAAELAQFGEPEGVIFNAGEFPANQR